MGRAGATILTVNVEGRDEKSPRGEKDRAALVDRVAEWIVAEAKPAALDAIVFPGGFGFLQKDQQIADHSLSAAVARLAKRLSEHGLNPQIILGFDTAPVQNKGGEQLAVSFNRHGLSGLARKIFPVAEDIDGKTMKPLTLHESDYSDQRRIISLPNGSRAVLCVCYDMFGIADTVRDSSARLEKYTPPGQAIDAQQFLRSFAALLKREKPDIAIATIHRFARPGVDRFWQRHGIAAASAALGRISHRRSFAVAAAHVGSLGDDFSGCRLASFGVPASHLDAGSLRRAETLDPEQGAWLVEPGQYRALIRLFQPR